MTLTTQTIKDITQTLANNNSSLLLLSLLLQINQAVTAVFSQSQLEFYGNNSLSMKLTTNGVYSRISTVTS